MLFMMKEQFSLTGNRNSFSKIDNCIQYCKKSLFKDRARIRQILFFLFKILPCIHKTDCLREISLHMNEKPFVDLQLIGAGDEQAFRQLFQYYAPRLKQFACSIIRTKEP